MELPAKKTKWSDFPYYEDLHPKSWLKPYKDNSVSYLLKMGFFYIGLLFTVATLGGTSFVQLAPPNVEDLPIPTNFEIPPLLAGIFAGPIEETLFFGIPYYLTGNPIVLLVLGIIWTFTHGLTFLFKIPLMFFFLRTWLSGKGWFAILFHTVWDISLITLATFDSFSLSEHQLDNWASVSLLALLSAVLMSITYFLYRRREGKSTENIIKIRNITKRVFKGCLVLAASGGGIIGLVFLAGFAGMSHNYLEAAHFWILVGYYVALSGAVLAVISGLCYRIFGAKSKDRADKFPSYTQNPI